MTRALVDVERFSSGARASSCQSESVCAREPVARVREAGLAAALPKAKRGVQVALVGAVAREAHESGAEAGARVVALFAAAHEEPVRLHMILTLGSALCVQIGI